MVDALPKKILCKVCLSKKPKVNFYDRADPIRPICRSCYCLATRYNKGKNTKDQLRVIADKASEVLKTYCRKKVKNSLRKVSYEEIKTQIFRRLGNKCYRCGEADSIVLQIDHINGGGCKERKGKGSLERYKLVLRQIDRYQILCANCNIRKKWENKE